MSRKNSGVESPVFSDSFDEEMGFLVPFSEEEICDLPLWVPHDQDGVLSPGDTAESQDKPPYEDPVLPSQAIASDPKGQCSKKRAYTHANSLFGMPIDARAVYPTHTALLSQDEEPAQKKMCMVADPDHWEFTFQDDVLNPGAGLICEIQSGSQPRHPIHSLSLLLTAPAHTSCPCCQVQARRERSFVCKDCSDNIQKAPYVCAQTIAGAFYVGQMKIEGNRAYFVSEIPSKLLQKERRKQHIAQAIRAVYIECGVPRDSWRHITCCQTPQEVARVIQRTQHNQTDRAIPVCMAPILEWNENIVRFLLTLKGGHDGLNKLDANCLNPQQFSWYSLEANTITLLEHQLEWLLKTRQQQPSHQFLFHPWWAQHGTRILDDLDEPVKQHAREAILQLQVVLPEDIAAQQSALADLERVLPQGTLTPGF
ncbi:MAG: hypothetical protein A3J38_09590 [Gammaproteobacteria bacterium RIFCSPHIGHO2_12_FULL_45_9]|nr:MAG: hypothetical protein A3J38_09590 [Gammaproteobacteria bacterium RIFCSPHIGHO2_12_FULL_45_9]